MCRLVSWVGLLALSVLLWTDPARGVAPEGPAPRPEPVPVEEYPVYDRVVDEKFLTSQTTLVLVRRLTVTRLVPNGEPLTAAFFHDNQFFGGRLPQALVSDFLLKAARPWRLEAKFRFGAPVRFVSGGEMEGPEVSLAPIPAGRPSRRRMQETPATVGILEFSRVAFTPRGEQALVYVGDDRSDGSGAGFLIWLRRTPAGWEVLDTEILWVARGGG